MTTMTIPTYQLPYYLTITTVPDALVKLPQLGTTFAVSALLTTQKLLVSESCQVLSRTLTNPLLLTTVSKTRQFTHVVGVPPIMVGLWRVPVILSKRLLSTAFKMVVLERVPYLSSLVETEAGTVTSATLTVTPTVFSQSLLLLSIIGAFILITRRPVLRT